MICTPKVSNFWGAYQRYRGYYYDSETGFYYVSSRYYDPEIGRFISPDTTDILTATPMGLTDKNLYAYCDNNPIIRIDTGGQFWDIVFDIVSLVISVVDVCRVCISCFSNLCCVTLFRVSIIYY